MNKVIQTAAAPPSFSAYAQAVEVPSGARNVHVSGQVGITTDGAMSGDLHEQHRQAWRNVIAVLNAADMDATNIVDVTAIVTDYDGVPVFREIRDEMLNGQLAGSTLLVCALASPDWKVEIAVRAAK